MGFWVTFSFSNSQPFASLNSRLRRWPAFALGRGERFLCGEPFWVPQLLLGISESRLGCCNPGGCAWMWEGGFDCLHPRCPQLHLLFACSVQVSMYISWRCFAVLPCWGSTTLASKAWEDRRYRRDSELLSDKLKMQAEDFRIKQHLQCFPNGFSAYDLFTTEVNRWHPLQWTLLHLAPTAFWFYRCSDGVLVDDFIEAIGPWGICWSQWPTSSSNGLCGEGMVDFLWHLISMQFCPVKLIFLNTNISMAQRGPYIEHKCHFGIL